MTAAKGSTGSGNIAGMHVTKDLMNWTHTPSTIHNPRRIPNPVHTSTKYYHEIGPCAYRNVHSDSECYKLHGYDRSFNFTFGCDTLDKQGFVVDFGGLKEIKRQLEYWFDHTVILQADDPMVGTFRALEKMGHMIVHTFPLISCEGLAEYVGEFVDERLYEQNGGRNWVISCQMLEAQKNTAIYTPANNPDRMVFKDIIAMTKEIEEQNYVSPQVFLG